MLTSANIQRYLVWDGESKTHSCFAYIEDTHNYLILAAANNKHRAMAVHEAMNLAIYRFNCGPHLPYIDPTQT